MKYDFLTNEENKKVNFIFDDIEKQFKKNLLTKLESDFIFFKKINKEFEKYSFKIFEICTNRKEFKK
ncbi:hypothetical protein AM4_143 [Lactococcus phage AM4]|uniref:Uncharacterized protein n=2 Tax=Audreyjarvisvirus AM4 TaxID=2845189 RepID=A0A1W6JKN9_9CAUD|nr:hypothetical protein H1Z35_gp109 [Lactococcus phage AM4]ARM66801.1 hypothetical protein AM4_143 [Lactococcus phage AM4]ARM66898.1 hypothetical protein AM5_045 [Lactococcus phage AM5]